HFTSGGRMRIVMAAGALVAVMQAGSGRAMPAVHVTVHVHVRAPRWINVPDVAALLDAAHGAAPLLCRLAARSIRNGGGLAAPMMPLGPADSRDERADSLSASDRNLLLDNLASADGCVREVSVTLLAQDDQPAVIDGLRQRLSAPDTLTRQAVTATLGMLGDDDAAPLLTTSLRDASGGVRANAAWGLGLMEVNSAASALAALFNDRVPLVRQAAVGAVGRLDSVDATDALIRRLKIDDVAAVRRAAAWALGNREAQTAGTALVAALATDQDNGVREMCAWALGSIGDHDAADGLAKALGSEHDTRTRRTIAWALGQLGVTPAPRALIAAVNDSSSDVRTVAAWAISEEGDAAAIPALRAALSREHDTEAARAEVRALVHSSATPEQLADLLESRDATVRLAVTRALGGHHGPDPWPWPMPRPFP
ncbi:MAG TPA: HEAT repeat domain-containing protein, partial [Burkholderiaceae bacterium]|nr:HEAT repeat domain-containing protein [Burkholderiaceae bacterium]